VSGDGEANPATVPDGLFDADGLLGGACNACGRRHFPRADGCPWCGATAIDEVRLATDATLWAWTAVTAAPPGYDGPVPYGFGVVELEADGLHVVTRLTESDPSRLHAGQRVRFTVAAVGSGGSAWAFAPA